jgi:hypothetical protein
MLSLDSQTMFNIRVALYFQNGVVLSTLITCIWIHSSGARFYDFCPRFVHQPPYFLSQRALCSWNVTQSCDIRRDPPVIHTVVCPSRPAPERCGDDVICEPVYQNVQVRFRHSRTTLTQSIAVGCVAVPGTGS